MKRALLGLFVVVSILQFSVLSNASPARRFKEEIISGRASREPLSTLEQRARDELERNISIFLRGLGSSADNAAVVYIGCRGDGFEIENDVIPGVKCEARLIYPVN